MLTPAAAPRRLQCLSAATIMAPEVPVIGREIMLNQQLIPPPTLAEPVLLYGYLQAVDGNQRTARLYLYGDEPVNLRFAAELDAAMLRLTNQYVKVTGRGRFSDSETWPTVQVEQISHAGGRGQPCDVKEFLNCPNPKRFDPDKLVTVSEPFDGDDFIRVIREGRDVGRGEVSG